ncbi:hypothetical protein OIT41_06925 [Arthrobacter sp. YA7-1]|uniref:hypothetical protein n=1 Tax=Arthrobacter sp. YA7-1 TaxID=2987701 RepID=UPI00222768C4|nr:hypothetical protein [Arthrobacter sp. YA7-1]UYY82775.1 hypothetical protein OIT41_06925 [Arthrobacter sp. YA7-1]
MSTPQVPLQPDQDPQAVPPASGGEAPRHGNTPPDGPTGQYPAPYGRPSQFTPPGQFTPPAQYPAPGQYSGAYSGPYAPPGHGAYPPHPYGMPVPPPAKNRKLLWIILGAVAAFVALVIVGVVVLVNVVGSATNRAQAVSDDFTRLIVNGQSSQAYDQYMNPVLTRSLTKDKFMAGIAGLGLDNTCRPHYDSVNVGSFNGNNTADVVGTLQCQGKTLDFRYNFEGNDLKMDAIRLQPQG